MSTRVISIQEWKIDGESDSCGCGLRVARCECVVYTSIAAMNSSTLPHNNSSTLPVVWNPQIPLELIVFERCIRDGEVKGGAKITPYSLFAKSGVAEACNEHERAALMQLVFLHEEFHNPSNITNNAFDESEKESAEVALKVSALMQQYRATVRDCLLAWNEADSSPPSSSQQVDGSNHVPTNDSSRENWTLLSQMHAVMHLAEIYLPLHAPFSNRINNNSGTLWRYQDVDLLEIPGYVTADTVRYLRTHTLQTAARSLNVPMEQLADMIDSKYPELNAFYWPYVMALVHRGCLDLVWTIISAHSLFRAHTAEESPDSEQQQDMNKHSRLASSTDRATSREIVADFWLLKSALLTAPLPGGRSEEQDDEDRSPDIDYDTNEMVDGVEFGSCFPSDYRLWDTTDRAYKGGPLQFSPKDALRKYNEWRNHVEELRQRFRLSHKIPQLDEVLACLVGDFSKCSFGSWTEQWCAELLYLAPDTRPRHMSLRALKLQKGSHSTDMNKAEIHIMDGNAGRALTTLNTFGGGSGAALPSTLVCLLSSSYCASLLVYSHLVVYFYFRRLYCSLHSPMLGTSQTTRSD